MKNHDNNRNLRLFPRRPRLLVLFLWILGLSVSGSLGLLGGVGGSVLQGAQPRQNMEQLHYLAKKGDSKARMELCQYYFNGRLYESALSWCKKAAKKRDTSAQFTLGTLYLNGHGVVVSSKKAVKWYKKAARRGSTRAQVKLGWMYRNGKHVAKSYRKAARWYKKASKQNHAVAQNNLALQYVQGRGVRRNIDKARLLFEKSAQNGDPLAQYNLGLLYSKGQGVDKNNMEAYKWLLISRAMGHGNKMDGEGQVLHNQLQRALTLSQREDAQMQARLWMRSRSYQ